MNKIDNRLYSSKRFPHCAGVELCQEEWQLDIIGRIWRHRDVVLSIHPCAGFHPYSSDVWWKNIGYSNSNRWGYPQCFPNQYLWSTGMDLSVGYLGQMTSREYKEMQRLAFRKWWINYLFIAIISEVPISPCAHLITNTQLYRAIHKYWIPPHFFRAIGRFLAR